MSDAPPPDPLQPSQPSPTPQAPAPQPGALPLLGQSTEALATDITGEVIPIARLELREERAQLDVDRFVQQHLTFRREVRTRTETHTAELRSEVLVITLAEGEAAVRIGEHDLQPGETFELLLYNERLDVSKRPYLSEIVEIGKQTLVETRAVAVDVQYEVLSVEEGSGLVRTLVPPEAPPRSSNK